MNHVVTQECDSIIRMDADDGERTIIHEASLVPRLASTSNVHKITNLVIIVSPSGISTKEAAVDLHLACGMKGKDICKQRDVQKHIAAKNQGTRG